MNVINNEIIIIAYIYLIINVRFQPKCIFFIICIIAIYCPFGLKKHYCPARRVFKIYQ